MDVQDGRYSRVIDSEIVNDQDFTAKHGCTGLLGGRTRPVLLPF